ncbi:carboxypeptidase-like regulatory domain-containing protein [Chitinophaga skermanii]|nr:carboxypeptidase-like regulatory domain-containing protein [Chitinophaga skermanii]
MQVLGWNWHTRVSLTLRNQPLSDACEQLEKAYGIHFSFSRDVVKMNQRVTLEVKNEPLRKVMDMLFTQNGILYKRIGEQVVLTVYVVNTRTINGYVEDARTGEKLIGATIYAAHNNTGTLTNQYGFYSLTVPKDTVNFVVSYIGYIPKKIHLSEKEKNKQLTVSLVPNNTLQEVSVKDDGPRLQEQTQMSKVEVAVSEVKSMPRLLGENDVLRAIQAMPGVTAGGDGASSLHVRGGSPDQNLILMDGTPVYNSSHLFGVFSVFNPDIIKHVDLYKGAFPARYGGRLSSVVDIAMKDGDMKNYHGEASIGLLAAKFMVEGPIIKDKTSFVVTGRRTYTDLVARPFFEETLDLGEDGEFYAYFYDFNAKVNHIFSPKDRLFLSAYAGQDNFSLKRVNPNTGVDYKERISFRLGWGNQVYSARWNHIFNPKLFSNLTLNYSQYYFLTDYSYLYQSDDKEEQDDLFGKYYSKIHDAAARMDFDFRPNPKHTAKFGMHAIYHQFEPGITRFRNKDDANPVDTVFNKQRKGSVELNLYGEDDWKLSDSLYANIGVHISGFMLFPQFYWSVQPRLGIRYILPKNWALKMSYTHMTQYIHLLANSTSYLPNDIWVPSTNRVKPMNSRQIAVGIGKTSNSQVYEASAEVYYKTMSNVIEFSGTETLESATKQWDEKVSVGRGWSYGLEVLFQKKKGKTRGWVAYTLSRSDRKFPNINNGHAFPYKYDRTHDLELVFMHRFNKHWEISGGWEYSTGLPLTLPIARYEGISDPSPHDPVGLPSTPVDQIGDRNSLRMKDIHRLDASVTYSWSRKNKFTHSLNFSLYNAYNRKNPFFYYYKTNPQTNQRELTQFSILPLLPSVTYALKF